MVETQQPLFPPASDWKPVGVYPSLKGVKRLAIDIETRDEQLSLLGPGVRRGAYIVGIAISIGDDGASYYYPIRHDGGGNLTENTVLDWLHDEAQTFTGEIVGANLQYDLDFLAEELITFSRAKRFFDVQIAEALIDENQFSYKLDDIAYKWLKERKKETLLDSAAKEFGIDKKKDLWRLHSKYVGEYAIGDVELPLKILALQEKELESQNLNSIWDLECKLVPVLLKMIRYGVRIDLAKLDECRNYFEKEEKSCYSKIKSITGTDITGNVNASSVIASLLQERGIVLPVTEKSQKPSTKANILEALDDDVARLVVRARKFNKATNTFCDSIVRHMTHGRIHPTYHQLRSDEGGTVSGRLSCSHPNIQQQPVRDPEIGRMWREIYVPEENTQWLRCDYSQQEPRIALHYAAKIKATGAATMVQKYLDNPNENCYTIIDKDTHRDIVKPIFLGLTYGMGGAKLCRQLGYPTKVIGKNEHGRDIVVAGDEGRAVIARFIEKAPYIYELAGKAKEIATERGYVTTLLGRRCRFPGGQFTHKALNRIVQGSAADMLKKAMVDLDNIGWNAGLTVHDELCINIPNDGSVSPIKKTMEAAVSLEVPVLVETTIGISWGDTK